MQMSLIGVRFSISVGFPTAIQYGGSDGNDGRAVTGPQSVRTQILLAYGPVPGLPCAARLRPELLPSLRRDVLSAAEPDTPARGDPPRHGLHPVDAGDRDPDAAHCRAQARRAHAARAAGARFVGAGWACFWRC